MKALFRKSDGGFQAIVDSSVNESLYENSQYVILEGEMLPKKKAVSSEGEEGLEWSLEALEDVSEINSQILNNVRLKRNELLKTSDWTQMPDSPLSSQLKTDWATYRQALRDLPQNVDLEEVGSVEDVEFPAEPSEE